MGLYHAYADDGNILRRTNKGDDTCGGAANACHNVKVHNSVNTGSLKWSGSGGWGIEGGRYGKFVCQTCHTPHNTNNIYLIREKIKFPDASVMPSGQVETPVDYRYKSATVGTPEADYAKGNDDVSASGRTAGNGQPATSSRPCEVCHSQTKYHRYNTESQTGGYNHNNAKDCVKCHSHQKGFAHAYGAGGGKLDVCIQCHGHDPGYTFSYTSMDGTTTSTITSEGRGNYRVHSTHTENDADDKRGPNVFCTTCHDPNNMPTFKSGTDMDGNGLFTLNETDVCAQCHSEGGFYNGVNSDAATGSVGVKENFKATNGDYARGGVYDTLSTYTTYTGSAGLPPVIVYDSDGTLKTGKEKWCAGCHDDAPPTINGKTAPIIAGDSSTYGFFVNGHGKESGNYNKLSWQDSAATGNPAAQRKCYQCHDTTFTHIGNSDSGTPRNKRLKWWDTTEYNNKTCKQCHDDENAGAVATAEPKWYTTYAGWQSSAHGSTAKGNLECTKCHEPHGMGGTNKPAMTRELRENLCYNCHTGDTGSWMNVVNNAISGPTTATSIEQAFGLAGTKHPVAEYKAFQKDGLTYNLTCISCHNVHLVTGRYWEADQGKSPLTRFSNKTAVWGDKAGEKMSDFAGSGTYETPLYDVELGSNFRANVMPDYPSFCLDCHSSFGGSGYETSGIEWNNNPHGKGQAGVPNQYGGHNYWTVGMQGFDAITPGFKAKRGRGGRDFNYAPWDPERRYAGANFTLACVNCHEVHGSNQNRMLRPEIGSGNPCIECHFDKSENMGGGLFGCGSASCHQTTDIHRLAVGQNTSGVTAIFDREHTVDIRFESVRGGSDGANGFADATTSFSHARLLDMGNKSPLIMVSATGSIGSDQVTVIFSKGVYTDMGSTGALVASDFTLTDTDNSRTITGVSHTAGGTTAVLTLSAPLDDVSDIGVDTIAAATGTSIYDELDIPMSATGVIITATSLAIKSIVASDSAGADGIQAGDKVVLTFYQPTQGNAINASNIDTALALWPFHTWKDGSGNIGSAAWNNPTNDTLTITLSAAGGVPTVASADAVTIDGTIKTLAGAGITESALISGTFDVAGSFGGLLAGGSACYAGGWSCETCDWLSTVASVQARVVPGKVGNAVQLDGNQCVEVGTDSCYSSTGTARATASAYEWKKTGTVEAWIYPTELTATRYVIASNELDNYYNYSLEITNDSTDTENGQPAVFTDYRLVFRFHTPTARAVYSSLTVPVNQWTHVAAVYDADAYDGKVVKIYMNGKDVTGVTTYSYGRLFSQPPSGTLLYPSSGANSSNTQELMIGCDPGIIDYRPGYSYGLRPFAGFKGKIDEFNLWNIARTPDQIAQDCGAPRIVSATGAIGSAQVTVTFSEGVYTSTGATGALLPSDFALTDTDNSRTITGVSHTAGGTTAVLTLSAPLDAVSDIDVDTLAAATGSSIYDAGDIPMDTRATVITGVSPSIRSVIASDAGGANGIQAGDKVVIKFYQATQGNTIDNGNINTALALPNGHTWNDWSGNIGSASWNSPTNDTLTITLSATSGVPTVAPGDMVTLGGTIKSSGGADMIDAHVISGTFDAGNFGGLPSGAVAYYNMVEGAGLTAHDTSGNGNDATLKNGVAWTGGRAGTVPNNAVSLNGGNNFLEAPDSNSLDLTDQGTIEVWAKKNSNRTYQAYVGKYAFSGSPLDYYGYMLGDANGQISLRWGRPQISERDPWVSGTDYYEPEVKGADYRYYKAGPEDSLISDCETAPVGQWNHILATYDGATMKIFLNGRLIKTGSYVKAAVANPYPLRIGASGSGGDSSYENALDGAVDEAVVYNRALTNDEARERFGAAVQPSGAIASDVGGADGIQTGDKVVVKFDGPTNGAVTTANIGTVLSLNNGHSWGAVQSAVWSTKVFSNDTLTVTLSSGATIDKGDVITTDGTVIKDRKGNAISATVSVSGRFSPLSSGVVAYYDFNEGTGNVVHDLTPNGLDGIAIGGASWIPGRNGQGYALDLDGSSGYVSVSECGDTPLDLINKGTFEFWLKKDSQPWSTTRIVSKGDGTVTPDYPRGTLGYDFYTYSSSGVGLSLTWGGEGGSSSTYSDPYLDINGEWRHVVATYDGGNARFYVDGQPVGAGGMSAGGVKSNAPVLFGVDSGLTSYLDGAIDEAIIYNRALTGDEVRESSGIPWKMKTAVAYDMGGASGIQTTDKVVITFDGPTQANSINAGNIDAVLSLSNGHTWKSGNGGLGNAAWSTKTFTNDTLTIIFSDAGGAPNAAVGDTITLDGVTITDHKARPVPVGSVVVSGTFGPLSADIVGYWNFTEGSGTAANDSSVYGNHGALRGDAGWTTGQADGAISLDGSGAYVNVNDSNSLDLSTREYYAIKALSSTKAWAVGQSGAIAEGTRTGTDFNLNWTASSSSPTTNHLYSIDSASATEMCAVGMNGTILWYNGSSWGASSWTSPVTTDLYSVDMLSATSGWAVGKNNVIIRFNGSTWSQVSISSPTATWSLKSVKMLSASEGWAVGGDNIATAVILKWNGTNWTEFYTTTAINMLNSIDMLSSTEGWAVGISGKILKFDGTSWTEFTSPTPYDLYSVKAISTTEALAVGANRTILKFKDTAWTINSNIAEVTGYPILRSVESYILNPTEIYYSGGIPYIEEKRWEYAAGDASTIIEHSAGTFLSGSQAGQDTDYSWHGRDAGGYGGATFEVWAWKNSNKYDQTYLAKQYPDSTAAAPINYRVKDEGSTGKPAFTVGRDSNQANPVVCSDVAPVGQWNHIVATGTSTLKIYLNGQLCGTGTAGPRGTSSTYPLVIGTGYYGGADFDGKIDHVTIYNRTLSGDEVWAKYGSNSVSFKSAVADDNSSGGSGIQAGDKVIITFNGPTQGTAVSSANINTVLNAAGKTWLDGNGGVSAVWSTTAFTNDTLTITLSATGGAPTVAVGDTITLSGLYDSLGRAMTGTIAVAGSFGTDTYGWTLDTYSEWTAGSLISAKPAKDNCVELQNWDVHTREIRGVDMLSPTEGWAVGANGAIRRWDGTKWKVFPSPIDSSVGSTTWPAGLYGIDMLSSTLGWAVYANTSSGLGKMIRFDGTRWSEETIPSGTPSLYVVKMLSSTDGWAAGASGTMLRYDGASWTAATSPTTSAIYAIDGVSSNEIWAAGSTGTSIFKWNGSSWTTYTLPASASIRSIHMLSASDGWAVGSGGKIFRYNGSSWSSVTSPTTTALYSVRMVSSTDGWAVGGVAGSGSVILRWNGSTWSTYNTYASVSYLYAVNMLSTTEGWALGYDGAIFRWNGSAWSEYAGVYSDYIWDMVFASDTDGWAISQSGKMLRYNGAEWTTYASPTTNLLFAIDTVSANEAWFAGPNDYFWKYLNGSWTSVANGSGKWMFGIDMLSSSAGWAVGYGIARWDGASWSGVASPTANVLNSVKMLSSTEGWAVGNSGTIIKWDGASWTTVASPTTQTLTAIDMVSSTKGWAVGYDNATNNGIMLEYNGVSWSMLTLPTPTTTTIGALRDIRMRSSTEGIAVAGSTMLAYDGTSWKYSQTPTDASYAVAYTPSGTPWTAGYATFMERVDYFPTGTVTNSLDAGSAVYWTNSSFSATQPAGTSVAFRWATSDDNVNWSAWTTNFASLASSRYIRQEATLSTANATVTPSLCSTTVGYNTTLSPPNPPTIGAATGLSATSIRWNFTDTANNETGFKLHDADHAVKASSATPNLTYLDETGLTANTQYTRHVHAYNAVGDSAGSGDATGYTLAASPDVTPSRAASSWSNNANLTFMNAAGFGAGGVQYYRYAWDQTAAHTFTGAETQWTSGTLTTAATVSGGWYLHLKSYNAADAGGSAQDYGPFNYETTAPGQVTGLWSSPASPTSANMGWTATSDTGGSGLAGYKVERAIDISGSPDTFAQAGTTTSNTWSDTVLLANARFWHRVRAYDNAGNNGAYSTAVSVMTLPVTPNVTSDKTASTWYNTTDVVFTNAAGFGAGGVQYYRAAWDQSATYTFTGTETQWSSGTLTGTATADGSWYLHVKSFNGDNIANGTQTYGPFYYDGTAPTGHGNSSPADGATGQATTTTLSSTIAVDGVSGGVQYYFQLAANSGFTTGVQTSGWQAGTSFTPVLAGSTTYYWRVKARDAALNETAYTATWSFTSVIFVIPATPTIGAPAALSATSIRWNFIDNATDEEGFRLHDSGHVVKASAATPNLTYLDETGLTANTQYTRHVHAYNAAMGDSIGSLDALTYTLSASPNVTSDKTASTWYNTTDVVFTNAAGFGAGGAQYYRYAWDQSATYAFTDAETQWTTGTLTMTATAEGGWYLHVKSFNGDNIANGIQTYGPFYYDITAPTGLANSSPADGATGQPTGAAVTSTVAADSGSGGVQYYFQLAADSGFTSGVQTSGWQAGTSFAPVLAATTTYYWHVKARDGVLNETPYTAAWSFTTVAATTTQMGGAIQGVSLSLTTAVTTLAGSAGLNGSTDGTGSAALFNYPAGITTDGTNLYVADFSNRTIRKIVISSGAVTTLAGLALTSGSTDGTGSAARFNFPFGITTDGTNLYVADRSNSTIRKIVISTGVVTTLAGTAGSTGSADGTGSAARFNNPYGITTDGTNLYVADTLNRTIRKIVISTGVVTTLAGTAGSTGSADGTGSAARFNRPYGITTDGTNLYVADTYNYTIRKIVISTAVVTTLAGTAGSSGSTDGTGSVARFYYPQGITTDGTNLYVADTYNMTIRKIVASTAVVTTLAGSSPGSADGTGSAARFYNPTGITTDGASLYVVDTDNFTIRKIQ
ncbi:MAG: hypothetical protein HY886_01360 [Deltaproteobacteria bacterium]|nr:hypothetical protein [Deltaproteobacteria bacterium]